MKSAIKKIPKKIKDFLITAKRIGGFYYRTGIEYLKTGWLRRNGRYARYYERMTIKKNFVLYESFFGRGMLCGPYALFLQMMEDPLYAHMTHVWVLDDLSRHEDILEQYKNYPNVKFVEYLSRGYLKYLSSAEYIVNNVTFPSFFVKKKGQTYINTWHGIPLKKLGYDLPNGAEATSNIIRNFLQADYLISANSFLTEIYKKAYKLDGIFKGKIIEEGYPRLDTLLRYDKAALLKKLDKAGVKVYPEKKVILYAPTWKETVDSAEEVLEKYSSIKAQLEQALPAYQVLIKAHQFVYALIREKSEYDYIVPATIDANEILPLADVLISDYSSIYFDYLYFERPILFYIPDLADYKNYRGLYFPLEELPGPYSENLSDIIKYLKSLESIKTQYKQVVKTQKDWCCNYDVGNISKHILDIIMQQHMSGYRLIHGLDQGKTKLLFHRGQMMVNGISTALVSLLNRIDLKQYDVSVALTAPKNKNEQELIDRIRPEIRVLIRKEGIACSYFENVKSKIAKTYGIKGVYKLLFPQRLYKREALRCFGDARFDYAIDYEGYNLFYAMIVASLPGAVHCIWLHNDMMAEHELKFPWLSAVFSCYHQFDRIVSCSQAIMEVNRRNLANRETFDKFTYAKNVVDAEKVKKLAKQKEILLVNEMQTIVFWKDAMSYRTPGKILALEPPPTIYAPEHQCTINDFHGFAVKNSDITLMSASLKKKNSQTIRFVTIGRLSPEKNHSNLIKAFQKFLMKGYDAMLFIVGEGPERKNLERQISAENLSSRVILTGNLQNPYALLDICDCFILPSLHEGQPVVINEARALQKPIIMTQFSSAQSSMIPNGQYVINSSVEGILDGLVAYAEQRVPNEYRFDADEYNQEAVVEFLKAIGEKVEVRKV